jgi:hypothetical protein
VENRLSDVRTAHSTEDTYDWKVCPPMTYEASPSPYDESSFVIINHKYRRTMISRVLAILALCLTIASALTSNSGVEASRRAFLGTSSLAFLASLPAFADDVDNLSIPEPDEKSEVSSIFAKKTSPLFSTVAKTGTIQIHVPALRLIRGKERSLPEKAECSIHVC